MRVFYDVEDDCAHLHTSSIPPLLLDLTYSLSLNGTAPSDELLLSLLQILKLQASEHSRRTSETRPGVAWYCENRLYPETLTLQQRVKIPIWHPLGMRGLHEDQPVPEKSLLIRTDDGETEQIVLSDDPHPEEWLPAVMAEVCQDITQVLAAFETTVLSNSPDHA